MKRVLNFIKRYSQLIISLIIVITVTLASVYAANTLYESNVVSYDNTASGLTSGNVQDALDELYGHVAEVIINIKTTITDLKSLTADNAGFHNSVFRGKDITSYYTDGTLYTRISNGSFEDLYVGDYIVANGITWRIAGFDIYYGKGDTPLNKNHVVIVPDTNLTTARMNETATTEGGYAGSEMFTVTLPNILDTYITPIFGDHVLPYRTMLTTAVDKTRYNRWGVASGASSAISWRTTKLNILNENQVYGSIADSSSGYETGSDGIQFPLFRLKPEYINKGRAWYWLRNVAANAYFVDISGDGFVSHTMATVAGGIRPYFYID